MRWLLPISLLLAHQLRAQESLRFDRIDFEDGLGSSWIFDIAEDSIGFIWFAGHTGLSRFDGVSCKHFMKDVKDLHSLSENQVFKLLATSQNRLLCSTIGGGLSILNQANGQFLNYNKNTDLGIPSNFVSTGVQVDSNTFYFSMGRPNSLVKLSVENDSISYDEIPLEWSTPKISWHENKTAELLRDPLDPRILWIIGNFRIYKFDTKTEQLSLKSEFDFLAEKGYSHELIKAAFWLDETHIFMSIYGRGYCSFDVVTGSLTDLMDEPETHGYTWTAKKMRDGSVWLGGTDGHIFRYSIEGNTILEIIPENVDLRNDRIETIFESSTGSIYIGTTNSGVLHYDPSANKFDVFHLPPEMLGERRSIFYNGILHKKKPSYFVTRLYEDYISRYDLETHQLEKLSGGFGDFSGIVNFAYWQDDRILFYTQNAVFEINQTGSSLTPFDLPLLESALHTRKDRIRLLATDQEETLVAVCRDFVYLKNGAEASILNLPAGENATLPCAQGVGITDDAIYLLCRETLQRLDMKTHTFSDLKLTGKEGFENLNDWRDFEILNDTFYISSGSAGVMIAVEAGDSLRMVDWLTAPNGILSNNVYASSADEQGALWFSTGLGLVRYDPYGSSSINFSYLQNLPDLYQDRPIYVNDSGFFAINDDAAILSGRIDDLATAGTHTRLVFNSIMVNGKEILEGISYPQDLDFRLEYKQNAFNFAWSHLYASAAPYYQLFYKLEGFDEEWILAKSPYEANYTNMPSGDFTFLVKAESVANRAALSQARIGLSIAAPFYATWWFRAIVILMAAALVTAFLKYRINTIRKEQSMIVAYDKQLADLKMQFLRAQMNPHFMFNSLNSIKHFILTNEREKASEYLSNFAQLIRSILSFSNARYISLADELNTLETYIGLERIRFSNGFEYQIKVSPFIDPTALLVQPLIFQPYVENAVWHGLMHKETDRILKIEIAEDQNMLTCSISDNGIGREKSASIKTKSNTRKSLGLQISELRMKSQDASTNVKMVDLKSDDGTALGTRVLISLPLKYIQTKTKTETYEDD